MRLRARLAARSGDQAAAVEASSNNDACETEADDFASCAPTEGPSAKEVGRAFLGDPEAEPAGHGGRSVSAAKASSHLRSLLLRFQRPHDEDEHSAASTCAGGNGEDYAYHGGAIFADDSREFDFGGDGHAALAAALFSETRDPDQVSIFTGVAEGAADGRLACSAERTIPISLLLVTIPGVVPGVRFSPRGTKKSLAKVFFSITSWHLGADNWRNPPGGPCFAQGRLMKVEPATTGTNTFD